MNAFKISKIILFVFSFFILSVASVNAASVTGEVTVYVNNVVNCVGSWSACLNGSQTYKITTPAAGGGVACSAVNGATQNCGPKTNCVGSWSSCINGIETYNITTPATNGGVACPAIDNDTKTCVNTCSAPLTKNITVACDLNANGDAAISGSVTRKQTKSAFPGCAFEDSGYVSDDCKYPVGPMSGILDATSCTIGVGESLCAVPYSWKVTNPEKVGASAVTESTGGKTLATGDSGNKSLTLSYNESTTLFLYNNAKELANKYVEAKLCSNCAWNPTTGVVVPAGPKVDGAWTAWSPALICPAGGDQTRTCIPPQNGGAPCPNDGLGTSRSVLSSSCPSLDIWFTWKDKKLLPTEKVVYNGIAKVLWTSENVDSCSCNYSDSTTVTSRSCGGNQNSPYVTPALKRDTTYTISCLGSFGDISKSVKIPVDKINPNYIEQ